MVHRDNPAAWVSWGQYCDAQYLSKPDAPNALRNLQYAAHCYCQGLRLGAEDSRDLLPRLLYLLSFENKDGEG
jgi:transformation/transcription domain-associated protein